MRYLILLLVGLVGQPGYAQPVADLASMTVGERYDYFTEDGLVYWTYLGPDGENHRASWSYPQENDTVDVWTSLLNSSSQAVRVTGPERLLTFSPHDCYLQLGECIYTLTDTEDPSVVIKATTTFIDGVYHVHEEQLLGPDTFTVDRACMVLFDDGIIHASHITYNDGYVSWQLIQSGFYSLDTALERVLNLCDPARLSS